MSRKKDSSRLINAELTILLALERLGSAYAAQISLAVAEWTESAVTLTPSSLYPSIASLEERGHISATLRWTESAEKQLRYFSLTKSGQRRVVKDKNAILRLFGPI